VLLPECCCVFFSSSPLSSSHCHLASTVLRVYPIKIANKITPPNTSKSWSTAFASALCNVATLFAVLSVGSLGPECRTTCARSRRQTAMSRRCSTHTSIGAQGQSVAATQPSQALRACFQTPGTDCWVCTLHKMETKITWLLWRLPCSKARWASWRAGRHQPGLPLEASSVASNDLRDVPSHQVQMMKSIR